MGNLSGSSKSKRSLKEGSVVVYQKTEKYKGLAGSPKDQQHCVVKEIYGAYVTLEETPGIQYELKDFFKHFVQII
jgi:hypothetical protein